MERRRLQIEDIHIGSARRSPDMARVAKIAESIRDVGLMNAPAVCIRDGIMMEDGEKSDRVPVLIYGRHRLLALEPNGETMVECVVYDVDDLHAELMEIDENLARAELSPAEEARCIRRRQEIWEEIESEKSGGRNSPTRSGKLASTGPQHQRQFAAEVANIVGSGRNPESVKRDVNLKIARARELGDNIDRIVGTSLDKGVEMDALIKLPEPERAALITRAESGEKVSARPQPPAKTFTAAKAMGVMARDLSARATRQSEPVDDLAEEVIDRFGKSEMPFLLVLLETNPKQLASAIRRRL